MVPLVLLEQAEQVVEMVLTEHQVPQAQQVRLVHLQKEVVVLLVKMVTLVEHHSIIHLHQQ